MTVLVMELERLHTAEKALDALINAANSLQAAKEAPCAASIRVARDWFRRVPKGFGHDRETRDGLAALARLEAGLH